MKDLEKVLIYTGRFQPFHKGHIKCIIEAYERTGLRTVIVGTTSTNRESNFKYLSLKELRYVFTKEQTLEIIRDSISSLSQYVAFFYIEDKNPNIYNIVSSIRKLEFEPSGWIFGKDRIDIKKQVENTKYHKDLNFINFQSIEIERNENDISATKIRNLIRNGEEFGEFMNFSNCNKVREWLLTYLYHQKS